MNKTLKCFVAIAFGRKDTDKLYLKSIRPMIRKLNIQPRCLNSIEHNDDLNNKIIKEIKSADLVVADLTFARPSVYYEAGYAERSIPVIYTCRKDHLKPQPKDSHGNLKVHFDLQMKNIIPWDHPEDSIFKRKLLKRIKYVCVPLNMKLKVVERYVLDKNIFHALPTSTKLSQLHDSTTRLCERHGFEVVNSHPYSWGGLNESKNKHSIVYVHYAAKYSKQTIEDTLSGYRDFLQRTVKLLSQRHPRTRLFNIRGIILFCSLEKLLLSKVRDYFPQASLDLSGNFLRNSSFEKNYWFEGSADLKYHLFQTYNVHVIEDIPFIEDYENRLDKILQLKI